jgi:hypothetical protein
MKMQKFTPDVAKDDDALIQHLVLQSAARYSSPLRPTLKHLYEGMAMEVSEINTKRAATGTPALRMPSIKTFSARVKSTNPSPSASSISTNSVSSTHPGKRVVFEQLMQFQVPGLRGVRLTGFVVTDFHSRALLGVAVATNSRDENAICDALWMSMKDKSSIAASAGSSFPWTERCRPSEMQIDAHFPAVMQFVREKMADLEIDVIVPPDTPLERPRSHWLEQELSGFLRNREPTGTMDDIVADVQGFLVRAACKFNHTAQVVLGGKTPRDEFVKSAETNKMRPFVSDDLLTIVLGRQARGVVGEEGIEFLGLVYRSPFLVEARDQNGQYLNFKYNPADMRSIAFERDGLWYLANSAAALPASVSVAELRDVYDKLRRGQPALAPELVYNALRDLRAAS